MPIIVEPATDAAPVQRPAAYRFEAHQPGDSGRGPLEAFVAQRFAEVHGAQVGSFLPNLLAMRDPQGALRCALGYRGAGAEALYLEQYLDLPVEQAISAALARRGDAAVGSVERGSIVEVGNLAGRGCRAALHMVARLPRFLMSHGYRWVTFTATERVRAVLASFEAPLLDLGPAHPDRLRDGSAEWGSYYRCAPRVMAGWLPHGLRFQR
ncbi:MAG: thermostable hemolysin [Steroidobacteraceae bacterium]